jgi:hypothetical protein
MSKACFFLVASLFDESDRQDTCACDAWLRLLAVATSKVQCSACTSPPSLEGGRRETGHRCGSCCSLCQVPTTWAVIRSTRLCFVCNVACEIWQHVILRDDRKAR